MSKKAKTNKKLKRGYSEKYEVSGVTPLSLDDCIWHLEKMDFGIDERLEFQRHSPRLGVEVQGCLVSLNADLTEIKADVKVMYGVEINYTLVIIAFWLFPSMVLVSLATDWGGARFWAFLSPFVGAFLTWVAYRFIMYRAARHEANRTIRYLHRRFDI